MKIPRLLSSALFFASMLTLANSTLQAAPITLSIINPTRIAAPGSVITFQGAITNNTGASLDYTDLFLNFSAFDPVNVSLNQLLGLAPFNIPDTTTSALLDLFTFTLGAGAAVPATFPAIVVLQTAPGDLSDPQTVTVSTVPEPSSVALLGIPLVGFLLTAFRHRLKMVVPAFLLILISSRLTTAQISAVQFSTSLPGLGITGSRLMVALPLKNSGTVGATNMQVTGVTLRSGIGLSPTSFPVSLGSLSPAATTVFQADFDATGLTPNARYLLTVRGTYQVGGITAGFAVNRFITIPAASPGNGNITTVNIPPHTITGAPYPPRPPDFGNEVNEPLPPIPSGPFVPGIKTPNSTSPVVNLQNALALQTPVLFNANNSVGLTSAGYTCSPGTPPAACAEPSGASGNGVVFVTANWVAAYSTNGGSTFTQLNPTTVFPADTVGFCCDQVVQYVPSIDRFIWLLQGGNGYRLAAASPAQIISSGGTAWTYWNLTPGVFGQPSGTGFDYPDLSVGNNYLYVSWDVGFPACPTGCNGGFEVIRIPLSQIQASTTIGIGYTKPSDSATAWGSHITQNTGDEVFWAGHNGNTNLRVFSLAESSNSYFWRDVGIFSWANNTLTAPTPDNQDWLAFGFPGSSIIGASRSGNQIWFAWTAGTDNNFTQAHVEMVTLDRSNNFNRTQQVQIWNNNFAFAYPALATNACTGEIGLSLVYGGNRTSYENHAVGFWGDFLVYPSTSSNFGVNRFGDYVTIRQDPQFGYLDAFGYGMNTASGTTTTDVRYVVFGRNCSGLR